MSTGAEAGWKDRRLWEQALCGALAELSTERGEYLRETGQLWLRPMIFIAMGAARHDRLVVPNGTLWSYLTLLPLAWWQRPEEGEGPHTPDAVVEAWAAEQSTEWLDHRTLSVRPPALTDPEYEAYLIFRADGTPLDTAYRLARLTS